MEKQVEILSVRQHSYESSRLITEIDHAYRLTSTADWLAVASSVESVSVVTGVYDESLIMCSQARTYEDKRSELLSEVTTQLAIFNFAWGAFESLVDSVIPKYGKRVRNSKVNRACWHFQSFCPDCICVPQYSHFVGELKALISADPYYERTYISKFATDAIVDDRGVGISVVRHIRNDLAHGSASIPVPDTWKRGDSSLTNLEWRHPNLVATATRLVLLTTQMLLLSYSLRKGWVVERLDHETDDYVEVPVEEAIRSLHFDVWR